MKAHTELGLPSDPKDKKSPTVKESLEALRDAGLKDDPRLAALDSVHVPEGFGYLFSMFWEVRGGSSESMAGVRVTWRDLADFQAVTGVSLNAFEVEAIMAMDATVQKVVAEAMRA